MALNYNGTEIKTVIFDGTKIDTVKLNGITVYVNEVTVTENLSVPIVMIKENADSSKFNFTLAHAPTKISIVDCTLYGYYPIPNSGGVYLLYKFVKSNIGAYNVSGRTLTIDVVSVDENNVSLMYTMPTNRCTCKVQYTYKP